MTTRSRSDDPSGPDLEVVRHCLEFLADRLRRLPESRLTRAGEPVRGLAQQLADAAAGIEHRTAAAPPELRPLPAVNVFALGDQLAVTTRDLLDAAGALGGAEPVWWRGRRQPLADVLARLRGAAEDLRAAL